MLNTTTQQIFLTSEGFTVEVSFCGLSLLWLLLIYPHSIKVTVKIKVGEQGNRADKQHSGVVQLNLSVWVLKPDAAVNIVYFTKARIFDKQLAMTQV